MWGLLIIGFSHVSVIHTKSNDLVSIYDWIEFNLLAGLRAFHEQTVTFVCDSQ